MSLLPDLEAQLLRAARRTQPASTPQRRRPWRSRGLLGLGVAAVLTGTAAAALLSVGGRPSPPLSGTYPGDAGPSARKYRVTLMPDLRAGMAGWCLEVAFAHGLQPVAASMGCGPAAPSGAAYIGGGGLWSGQDGTIVWAVVDRRVAVVRLGDGQRILPRADPRLPFGWRAVVAFGRSRDRRHIEQLAAVELLDAHGRLISRRPNRWAGTRRTGTRPLPTVAIDPQVIARGRCVINHNNLRGLRVVAQEVVRGSLTPEPVDVNGRAFRTCGTAVFKLDGRTLRAAVLVDAVDPRRRAAELPPSRSISARRAGPGWLVVSGRSAAARAHLLDALTTRTE